MWELVILLSAAFAAGVLNAIAGGGSFLTFPALVYLGIPPVPANATSAVAVFPGYLSGALGFTSELRKIGHVELALLLGLSALGGIAGALLLVVTSAALFNGVVPWLLLAATLLFAFDKQLRGFAASGHRTGSVGKLVSIMLVTTYGGYFNGGLGIVLLSLLSAMGYRDLNVMNGLKNAMSFVLCATSVVTFAATGLVHWTQAGIMMVAATLGGYFGAQLSKVLPEKFVRLVVIGTGVVMTGLFYWRST